MFIRANVLFHVHSVPLTYATKLTMLSVNPINFPVHCGLPGTLSFPPK